MEFRGTFVANPTILPRILGWTLLVIGTLSLSATICGALARTRPFAPHHPLEDFVLSVRGGDMPFQLEAANNRVNAATVHLEPRHVYFSENWLQHFLGQFYTPLLSTQDTHRLIAGKIANCSERSQILKSIAEWSGYESRFVGLNGHVVLEVRIEGEWHTADPDYNLTFDMPVAELAASERTSLVFMNLLERGYDVSTINRYLEILQRIRLNRLSAVGGT